MSNESAAAATVLNFAQVSPPRLLFALLHKRFTGTMDLEQPAEGGHCAGPRRVWFSGGMPVFTNWVSGPDVLGRVLLELRQVDEATLTQALAQMAQMAQNGGSLLGETLTRQGAIDEQQLADALRFQCGRKLSHLFAMREGEATLQPTQHELVAMTGVNVLELMLAAVGRHYDETRVRAEMGAHLESSVRVTAAYARYQEHFRFRPTDAPLLDALVAGTDFKTLAGASQGGPRRAAQLIYVLWASQMLYTGASAQHVSAPQPAPQGHTPAPAPKPAPAPHPVAAAAPAAEAPFPASTPARGPSSPEHAAFLAELEAFEAQIADEVNPFALLGLDATAGRKELRAVWSGLSRRMHPDALQAKGWEHLRERVNDVFAALSEANTTLSNKEERERISAALGRGEEVSASADAEAANMARAAFESEVIARDGDRYLKANKFDRANAEFKRALELVPDEPDYQAAAIWCEYNLSGRSRGAATRAENLMGTVLELSPNLARAQMWRGHILRDLGAAGPAIICYERALKSNPRLIDAERYLRALKMARGQSPDGKKPEKKKSGLRGFFGKS